MMRVDGPSFDDLDLQIEAMDGLVQSIAARIFDQVADSLGDVRVGAAPPPAEPEEPGEPFVSLDSLVVILTLWASAIAAEIVPALTGIFYSSLEKTREALFSVLSPERGNNLPDTDSDLVRTLAEEYLATAPNRMSGFGDDMWNVARGQLLDGFMKGESIYKLRDRLRASVGLTAGRASLVARTEVISASNAGSLSMIEIAGFTGTKTWLATEDLRTRPTHVTADGQTVPMSEAFNVGGFPLFFPGDPAAPPEEICNCRCTLTYDLDDEPLTATGVDMQDEPLGIPDPVTAAVHVLTIPDVPPAEWFQEPTDVEIKGAITITDEGRVYGYIGPDKTAHRGYSDRDIRIPMGNVDYGNFLKGETIVAGGGRVVAGVITADCGHSRTASQMDHYDNTCSMVASVNVGEWPGRGVWMAGALLPGVSFPQIAKMMAGAISGEWRPMKGHPGRYEFMKAVVVPVPGFAMARTDSTVTASAGEDGLVAYEVPVIYSSSNSECDCGTPTSDLNFEFETLAASVGLDLSSRMNVLREKVVKE